MRRTRYFSFLPVLSVLLTAALAPAADWPEWRGPSRDGKSDEKGLPEKWDLAWKMPHGSRSAPIVMGGRLYLQNTSGKGVMEQERLMCFDADTGKLLWEFKFNVFQSDIPAHRVGWASPAGDPATGNVYVLGGGGSVYAVSKEGKVLWERSLTEEMSLFTTHGGRTVSPIIDGDLVIVSGPTSTWGPHSNRSHRFIALNKRNGETVWISTPGGRPYDTTYSMPTIADVNGTRLLIAGGGDGAVHAMKPQTGEPVWRFEMAKRGVNTAVVMNGTTAIVSHSEENLDTSDMGLIAGLDATAKGKLGPSQVKWKVPGFQGGFSSPIVDGDSVYQVDNGANLYAFDVVGGKELWRQQLGTIQKASPVMADGKLYVGTETGKFFILKPGREKCNILAEQPMALDEQIIASVAIANGRVYIASMDNLYCIGKAKKVTPNKPMSAPQPGSGPATWVQVTPTELILKPGDKVKFTAKSFDEKGQLLREEKAVTWTVEGIKGSVAADGTLTVAAGETAGQVGVVKAAVGGVTGEARGRVIPPLPWKETFESYADGSAPAHWVGTTAGRFAVKTIDGNKVFEKGPTDTLFKRMRLFFGPWDWSNYTVECDVRLNERRRQLGDAGIVGQRYALMIFGNQGTLELQPWQPETERTVRVPFEWKKDTWYTLKLRVENAGGKTRVLGKAWPTGETEPTAWMIDKVDPIPNVKGAAGIFADAQFGALFDNLKVTPNQ